MIERQQETGGRHSRRRLVFCLEIGIRWNSRKIGGVVSYLSKDSFLNLFAIASLNNAWVREFSMVVIRDQGL